MALIGSIALSMVANTSGLAKGLAKGASAVESWGSAATKRLAAGAAVGGAALAALGVKAGASAAHLEEAYNKTDQVFGEHGASVIATANKMADAYGTERQAYLDGTAALGGQLQGVGYAEKDAAALSTQLANLAADAAAFRDVGFDDALLKIRSGLSGEAEPLKAWGMDISDAAVKTEGLRLGLVKAGQEMDNSAKVQARMSLIQKGLAKDSGALARESTGTAAQMSEFWGRLAHLMETVGQTTAPILGGALLKINTVLAAASAGWESMTTAAGAMFSGAGEGISGFVSGAGDRLLGWGSAVLGFFEIDGPGAAGAWNTAVAGVGMALHGLGAAWDFVGAAALKAVSIALTALGGLGRGLDWVLEKVGAGSTGVGDYLDRMSAKVDALAQSRYAAFGESWAGMDFAAAGTRAIEAVDGAISATVDGATAAAGSVASAYTAAQAKIDAARQELATAKQEEVGPPKAAEAAAEPAKGKASEFAEAMKLGSTAAASTLLRSRYGLGKDGAAESAKQTAANTKEIVPSIKEVAAAINRLMTGGAPTVAI